jgi:peptidoglycan/xylan/chitin deacetylase (PgdA/CDA1 family)
MNNLVSRITGKYRRTLAERICRRMMAVRTSEPIISFSFDDAPKTAFITGSDILKGHGIRGTFFVSLGLLGSETEVGMIASELDLLRAVEEGNELGCHTFDHLESWQTTTEKFIESIVKNKEALKRIIPGLNFQTFAYPISGPRPSVKFRLEKHFACCRGGGQTANIGNTDLNLLKAYFLDRRNKIDLDQVKRIIDHNATCRGWLIFATHDVTDNPSRYGCTPEFFAEVVDYTARSGALSLPVGKAYELLQVSTSDSITSE